VSERIDLTEAPLPPPRRPNSRKAKGGGASKLGDFARTLTNFGSMICGLLLLYLFWGLWSGVWSHEGIVHLNAAGRLQQLSNVIFLFKLLDIAALVTVIALLICCARAEGTGYWLLGTAAFFYAGVTFLTNLIYYSLHQTSSQISVLMLGDFQTLAWLFAVPGVIWTTIDLAKRFGEAAELAAIQRANVKYGAKATRQTGAGQGASRQRQLFLGRCWEGPFCRDNIRVKCPIYLQKRGPCWWYKKGCMCEESIVLQVMISADWREKSAEARRSLESGGSYKNLSPEAKRERCRNCIIYNEHQRQKHKALTIVAIVAMPILFVLNFATVQGLVGHFLQSLDAMTRRFSYTSDSTGIRALHNNNDAYGIIVWVFVLAFGVILLSQVMKLIEYCCFKLKI
jgi:hypothetical protein